MGAVRVGILQTDEVLEEFQPRFGDYPEMFELLLRSSASAAAAAGEPVDAARWVGNKLSVTTYRVFRGVLPDDVQDQDAYLITGSRHSVYDDLDWIRELVEFLRQALAAERKIIGICFGHQLLAHFFGGETRPADAGWAVGVHRARLLSEEPWMLPRRASVGLLSSHKDQVATLPEGARLIASSDFCPLAGFVMGDLVMTLQGHPEFSRPYAAALMHRRRDLLGPATFDAGMASLEEDTDEATVGRWLLNFIFA